MDLTGFKQHRDSSLFVPFSLAERVSSPELVEPPEAVVEAPTAPLACAFADNFPPALFEPLEGEPGPLVRLMKGSSLRRSYELNRTQGPRNKSDREMVQGLLKRMFQLGTLRRCGLPEEWEDRLDQLHRDHPNFSQVIDFLRCEFSLASATKEPARLPAILLNGPPGCGKTYFAEALSRALDTGHLRVNLETGQTPAELTGTASHWSNSQPGRLFDLLVNGRNANPVVVLDEVDKAGGAAGHSVDRALYAILDTESAKEWSDASLPLLKMNLSHVVWVLTSNDWTCIPPPLLSRMEIFHVSPPSRAEAAELARRMFATTASDLASIDFSPELSASLATMLALYPLRTVQRLCRTLIASAVRDSRRVVEAKDFTQVGADRAALHAFGAPGLETSVTKH